MEFIGLGLSIGIGTLGEALVVKQAIDSLARQPEMASTFRTFMIVGAAIVETGIIYSFILGLLIWVKME